MKNTQYPPSVSQCIILKNTWQLLGVSQCIFVKNTWRPPGISKCIFMRNTQRLLGISKCIFVRNTCRLLGISHEDHFIVITYIIKKCWRTYCVTVAIFSSLFSWCVFFVARDTLWICFIHIQILYRNNEQKNEYNTQNWHVIVWRDVVTTMIAIHS